MPFLVPFVSHTEVTLLFLYHKSIAKNRQLCVLLFWRLEVQEWVTLLGRPLYHYKVGKEKEKCEEAGLTVISPPSPGNLISDPQPVLGAPLWANHLSMAGYAREPNYSRVSDEKHLIETQHGLFVNLFKFSITLQFSKSFVKLQLSLHNSRQSTGHSVLPASNGNASTETQIRYSPLSGEFCAKFHKKWRQETFHNAVFWFEFGSRKKYLKGRWGLEENKE